MKDKICNSLIRSWYQKPSWITYLLLPLSKLFEMVVKIRYWVYLNRWLKVYESNIPIIIVGNMTVGGTGKTPCVISLTQHLITLGYKPAIVSRGYGRKKSNLMEVKAHSLAEEVGDEPLLLYHATGCPVVVAADRVSAVRYLEESSDCNVIISDDGLQHYRMGRVIEIAIIDGQREFGNGYCLPAGPLREPLPRLKEVDCIIYNGRPKKRFNHAPAFEMKIEPQQLINLLNPQQTMTLEQLAGERVLAVSGIGNPERFYLLLKYFGIKVEEYTFPDHHLYSPSDLDLPTAGDKVIITEKDAIKCQSFAHANLWYLKIKANLSPQLITFVESRLREYLTATQH